MRALPDEQGPSLQTRWHSFCFATRQVPAGKDPHRLHHGRFLSHPDGPDGHPEGFARFSGDASGDFTSSPKELSDDRIVYAPSAGAWVAAFDQRTRAFQRESPGCSICKPIPTGETFRPGRYAEVTSLKKELLAQMKKFKEPALSEASSP